MTAPPPSGAAGPVGGPDPLDELGQRVRAAQEAAERIIAEARGGEGAGGADRPPPRGYAAPGQPEGAGRAETQAAAALLELGRGMVPPELRQALADLVRELLLLLRALIDWYLERLEARRGAAVEVEDIPIS